MTLVPCCMGVAANGPSACTCPTETEVLRARIRELEGALECLVGGGHAGTWKDATMPLIARFETAAKFNADAVHNSVGADAIAKLMKAMAEKLDNAGAIARAALDGEGL